MRERLEDKKTPYWGECDLENRIIRIDERASGIQEFDTAAHEYLHARFPFLDESEVREASTELINLLELIRYRRLFREP